jgi:hypothetical protein
MKSICRQYGFLIKAQVEGKSDGNGGVLNNNRIVLPVTLLKRGIDTGYWFPSAFVI